MAENHPKAPLGDPNVRWESRVRGYNRWDHHSKEPTIWWLQCEYRAIDTTTNLEVWRSAHINGYNERP